MKNGKKKIYATLKEQVEYAYNKSIDLSW